MEALAFAACARWVGRPSQSQFYIPWIVSKPGECSYILRNEVTVYTNHGKPRVGMGSKVDTAMRVVVLL